MPGHDREELLAAVLQRPGDLTARLAYAEALEADADPLGEFIRLDCGLDGPPGLAFDRLPERDRRFALLDAHRAAWFAPLAGLAGSIRIERGLVGSVGLDLDTYLARGAEVFDRFPVRAVALRGVHGRVGELLASPWIDRIESLALFEPRPRPRGSEPGDPGLDDADVVALAASPRLAHLRGLDLGHNPELGPRSVEAVLDAAWCTQLETLGLGWTGLGDAGAASLAATDRLASLRRLNLSYCGLTDASARALAESASLARLGLAELDIALNHEIGVEGYAPLLRSPALARVEALDLDGAVTADLIEAFERSDTLGSVRSLTFGDSWDIDADAIRRLAGWRGLARLDRLTFILSKLDDDHVERLARSPWLGDLKSFSLSETRITDDGVDRLCRSPAWRGLWELGIDRSRLTERSIRSILSAGWFGQLRSLYLHAVHDLGDAGAAALAAAPGPTQLRRLTMSMAGIGDLGALALARAPFAGQLWRLWLCGNDRISPAIQAHLQQRLGRRVFTDLPRESPVILPR